MKLLMYLNTYEYLITQILVIALFIGAVLAKEKLELKSYSEGKGGVKVVSGLVFVFAVVLCLFAISLPIKQKMEANWLTSSKDTSIQFEEYVMAVDSFVAKEKPFFEESYKKRVFLNLADSVLSGYNKNCYEEAVFKDTINCNLHTVRKILKYTDAKYGSKNWELYKSELVRRIEKPNYFTSSEESARKYIEKIKSMK